jgi:hypothetical protein
MSANTSIGATALPSRAEECVMPWAMPRLSFRTHDAIALVEAGKVAPSPRPSSSRAATSVAKPPARPVSVVATAQMKAQAISVRLAPKRSLTQPPMNWNST